MAVALFAVAPHVLDRVARRVELGEPAAAAAHVLDRLLQLALLALEVGHLREDVHDRERDVALHARLLVLDLLVAEAIQDAVLGLVVDVVRARARAAGLLDHRPLHRHALEPDPSLARHLRRCGHGRQRCVFCLGICSERSASTTTPSMYGADRGAQGKRVHLASRRSAHGVPRSFSRSCCYCFQQQCDISQPNRLRRSPPGSSGVEKFPPTRINQDFETRRSVLFDSRDWVSTQLIPYLTE